MATPQYDLGRGYDAPLSGAPPVLEIPRGWAPRIALIVLVAPGALALVALAVGLLMDRPPEVVGAAVSALAGLLLGAIVVWRLWAEMARSAAMYEQGVELATYRGKTTMRWEQIEEIGFFAQKVQAGGLIGMAIGAGIDKLRGPRPLDQRGVTIQLRLTGGGATIKLSNNDKGVFAAWQEAMRRVNPRLIADVMRRARAGERVEFGKKAVAITATGISFKKKAEISWQQIEKLSIVNGQLSAKITGKWLSSGAAIAQIPNLFVLTAAVMQLSGGTMEMDVQPNMNLATRVYA